MVIRFNLVWNTVLKLNNLILITQVSGQELAASVRGHWWIDSMHWQLDVVFREDANKTLNKQVAFNLNVMNKFCLAVLKQLDVGKR